MLNSRVQTLLIMATGLFGHKQRLWHIIPVIGRRTAEKNAVFGPKSGQTRHMQTCIYVGSGEG